MKNTVQRYAISFLMDICFNLKMMSKQVKSSQFCHFAFKEIFYAISDLHFRICLAFLHPFHKKKGGIVVITTTNPSNITGLIP